MTERDQIGRCGHLSGVPSKVPIFSQGVHNVKPCLIRLHWGAGVGKGAGEGTVVEN